MQILGLQKCKTFTFLLFFVKKGYKMAKKKTSAEWKSVLVSMMIFISLPPRLFRGWRCWRSQLR